MKRQRPPHLPVDALLRMRQRGFIDEDPDSVATEDRDDDLIEVRRGSARTERRPSAVPASLDGELILSAFRDLTGPLSGGTRSESRVSFLTAAEWLLSRRDADYLFSFPNVCARLELDAGYIARETLRRLDRRRVELVQKHFARFGLEWLAERPDEPTALPEAA